MPPDAARLLGMRSLSPSAAGTCLAVLLAVTACRPAPLPEPWTGRTCGGPPRGVTQLLRAATVPASRQDSVARLVVHVRESVDARGPIWGSQVFLEDSAGVFAGGQLTDSTGVARFDTLPARPLILFIRRIGYAPAQFAIRPRVGALDSLFVELATQPLCIGF